MPVTIVTLLDSFWDGKLKHPWTMQTQYSDKRKAIAGEFFLQDSRTKNRSRKAYKKIQTWKESRNNARPDTVFRQQAQNQLHHAFFHVVTNAFILLQERYYDKPMDN